MSKDETNARLRQILKTSPRVDPSLATPGWWRPAGTNKSSTRGVVVSVDDLTWMVEKLQTNAEKEE